MGASTTFGSMLLSCLSAHAALTIFDGIERVRLPVEVHRRLRPARRCRSSTHARGSSRDRAPALAHGTRCPRSISSRPGYDILIRLARRRTGASPHAKMDGPTWCSSRVIPSTIRRACCASIAATRDATCDHERDDLPFLPFHCVSPEDWEQLEQLHERSFDGARDPRSHRQLSLRGGRRPRSVAVALDGHTLLRQLVD